MPLYTIIGRNTTISTAEFRIDAKDDDDAEEKGLAFMDGPAGVKDANGELIGWELDGEDSEVIEVTEDG